MKKEIKFTLKQIKDFMDSDPDLLNGEIIFLKLLHDKNTKAIEYYFNKLCIPSYSEHEIETVFKTYERKGFIKVTDWNDPIHNYQVRAKLKNILGNGQVEVETWIEDWRELFPKGSNRAGYRYRGDKQGCISKMKSFVNKHPKIHKEQIFQATKKYVKRFAPVYMYMKQAHYFIEKDGASTLLGEIEGMKKNENVEETVNSKSI